ncbi:MAG: hypothetical protein PUG10_11750 [Lachnospiraceae bacterium]|nr:hypothetical protein [Lachnospiraceae bacterium]
MGIKDIDLNKDGVTLGDHIDNLKDKAANLFDGDDTNSNNIIDRISHQMLGSNLSDKIDSVVKDSSKKN